MGFRGHAPVGFEEGAAPGKLDPLLGQHPALHPDALSVQQGLPVVDLEGDDGQLKAAFGEVAVGQARPAEGVHTGFLQPGQITAMPHHSGMVGVLGQHRSLDLPRALMLLLRHGLGHKSRLLANQP